MNELSMVIDAAFDEARQLLRSTPRDRIEIRHKTILLPDGTPRSSPVTDLDVEIQRLVFSRLRAHLGPDVGLLGEEDGHDRRDALTKDPCAILDPLDGTKYWLKAAAPTRSRWPRSSTAPSPATSTCLGWAGASAATATPMCSPATVSCSGRRPPTAG